MKRNDLLCLPFIFCSVPRNFAYDLCCLHCTSLMFWKGEGYDLNHNELLLLNQADLAFNSCLTNDLLYQFVYVQHAL